MFFFENLCLRFSSQQKYIFTYNSNSSLVSTNAGEYTVDANNKFIISFEPDSLENFDSSNLPDNIKLEIVNESKFDIYIYSYDNDYDLLKFTFKNNSSISDIYFIDNLTKKNLINVNGENFYEVIIEVSKDGFIYSRLISGVKK